MEDRWVLVSKDGRGNAPRFPHDCEKCRFIQHLDQDCMRNGKIYRFTMDLWVCTGGEGSAILRFGELGNYYSTPIDMLINDLFSRQEGSKWWAVVRLLAQQHLLEFKLRTPQLKLVYR